MGALLGLLERLLAIALSILGLSQMLEKEGVKEHSHYLVENKSTAILTLLEDPAVGLAALILQMSELADLIRGDIADITAPAGEHSVVIGNDEQDAIAAKVWRYYLEDWIGGGVSAQQALEYAGAMALNTGENNGFRMAQSPWFMLVCWGGQYSSASVRANTTAPQPTWGASDPGEHVTDWLNRTDVSGYVWMTDDDSQRAWAWALPLPSSGWRLICLLSDYDLANLRGNAQLGNIGAPVWPGSDLVLKGDPVPIAEGVTIAEEMDGVLFDISAVPPGVGSYGFDGHPSWVHLGAVAFYDDEGHIEPGQTFSFETQLLTPTRMSRASGCYIRSRNGVVGTVTPWTIWVPTP